MVTLLRDHDVTPLAETWSRNSVTMLSRRVEQRSARMVTQKRDHVIPTGRATFGAHGHAKA
jgi:hypothetical protein